MSPGNGRRSTLAESTSAPRASRDANHHPYPQPGLFRCYRQGARPEEHANADSQRDRDDYQPRPGLTGAMIATTRLGTKSASRPRSLARRRSRSPRPIRRPRCPSSARACPPRSSKLRTPGAAGDMTLYCGRPFPQLNRTICPCRHNPLCRHHIGVSRVRGGNSNNLAQASWCGAPRPTAPTPPDPRSTPRSPRLAPVVPASRAGAQSSSTGPTASVACSHPGWRSRRAARRWHRIRACPRPVPPPTTPRPTAARACCA
jgi:hypothetical protein